MKPKPSVGSAAELGIRSDGQYTDADFQALLAKRLKIKHSMSALSGVEDKEVKAASASVARAPSPRSPKSPKSPKGKVNIISEIEADSGTGSAANCKDLKVTKDLHWDYVMKEMKWLE